MYDRRAKQQVSAEDPALCPQQKPNAHQAIDFNPAVMSKLFAMSLRSAPSTSFQTWTSGTCSAAPISVAVRSLPPRPKVVIAPAPDAQRSSDPEPRHPSVSICGWPPLLNGGYAVGIVQDCIVAVGSGQQIDMFRELPNRGWLSLHAQLFGLAIAVDGPQPVLGF